MAWASYRVAAVQTDSALSGDSLGGIADVLAVTVQRQWKNEAAMRRLYDPYSLQVSWKAADRSLFDSWAFIVKLGHDSLKYLPAESESNWAVDPAQVASEREVSDVFSKIPTRRLVVLGEPGSGKTILLIQLALELLNRRSPGDPVPILLSASAWDPVHQGFDHWLLTQICTEYPGLSETRPEGLMIITQARALFDAGLIVPIIDGLDEIPNSVRGAAIARINDTIWPFMPMVLTSRTKAYQESVRPTGNPEITLRGAIGIELQALDSHEVATYLQADSGGPLGSMRWEGVIALLGTEHPVATTLANPLMLSMARIIYNPRPEVYAKPSPHPNELRSFTDRATLEQHLLDAFVASSYRYRVPGSPQWLCWSPIQAAEWLSFLARHLEYKAKSSDFNWWDLRKSIPTAVIVAVTGMTAAIAFSLVGAWSFSLSIIANQTYAFIDTPAFKYVGVPILGPQLEVPFGVAFGIAGGVAVAIFAWMRSRTVRVPSKGTHWMPGSRGIASVIPMGLAVYLAVAMSDGFKNALVYGGAAMLLAVVLPWLWPGRTSYRIKSRISLNVRALVAGTLIGGLTTGIFTQFFNLTYGLTVGAIVAVALILACDHPSATSFGIPFGLLLGIIIGLAIGLGSYFALSPGAQTSENLISSLSGGLASGLIVGLILALIAVFTFRLEEIPEDVSVSASPLSVLQQDRRAALTSALTFGLALGIGYGLTFSFVQVFPETWDLMANIQFPQNFAGTKEITLHAPIGAMFVSARYQGAAYWHQMGLDGGWLEGLPFGLASALVFGLVASNSAWPQWLIAHCWLASQRKLPWRINTFLHEAHQRGVLRQAGSAYQFRHVELQRRLAAEEWRDR